MGAGGPGGDRLGAGRGSSHGDPAGPCSGTRVGSPVSEMPTNENGDECTETPLGSTPVVRNTRDGSRESGKLRYRRRPAVHA